MYSSIGIDYTPAYEQGAGIGRYVRELVAALAGVDQQTAYRLFVAGVCCEHKLPVLPGVNFEWRTTRMTPKSLARLWHRLRVPYPVENWAGPVSLFHATDFVLPPTRQSTRTIVTVHDLSFVHLPETTSPRLKQYLDAAVPRSVKRADHVLADSRATKDDLIALYHVPPEKITVLLSGVDGRFQPVEDAQIHHAVRQKYHLDTWPFMFTIGTVQPRKNYMRLFEALQIVHRTHPDLHLVIAGGKGWLDDPIYRKVEELKLVHHVHFIGFADDADLPALYNMAEIVPYISLYEGFGLPVLEAMACRTPVVTSNVSSMPEVAGDAALLVDPYSVDEIAEAVGRILDDAQLSSNLAARGLEQASLFTWRKAATQLVAVYRNTLQQ